MDPIKQWKLCCLDPDYWKSLTGSEILFSDRYIVQHVDHWTGQLLIEYELISSAGFFPGVKVLYPANSSTEKEARKEARKLFDQMEGNCNACRCLERFPTSKHPRGFMKAFCQKRYRDIQFHPEDPMYLDCWEGR